MRLLTAALLLLLLLLALCAARVDGECPRGVGVPCRRPVPSRGAQAPSARLPETPGNPGGHASRAVEGQGIPRAPDGTAPGRSVAGSKCKCSRKGPKIRYSDVKKLEMKPKYPHCEEKMVM